jgi:pimeloyl-ACP methyl ester carboxylesterase
MRKLLVRISLGLSVLAVICAAGALGYRAWRQSEAEKALVIATPNGIDEAMFASINGREQWIAIRGRDRRNPILLILHGGPGFSTYPAIPMLLPFERDYVVVHWDQPLSGRSYSRRQVEADLTAERVVADGIAVAEFLESRFNVDRIVLLGWSWGSFLGIEMAKRRPDLFVAFVGTGQIVNMKAGDETVYAQLVEQAAARADQRALDELRSVAPPFESMTDLQLLRGVAMRYEGTDAAFFRDMLLFAPRFSLGDLRNWLAGIQASNDHFVGADLQGELEDIRLDAEETNLDVPVLVIHGSEDYWVPLGAARSYVDALSAPAKDFVAIDGGHFAFMLQSDEFVQIMNERLAAMIDAGPRAR